MVNDPLNIFGDGAPVGRQRTQPLASSAQQAPARDPLGIFGPATPTQRAPDDGPLTPMEEAARRYRQQREAEERRRLTETPADAKRRAEVARQLGVKPSEVTDLAFAERAAQAKRQMGLREKYPAIGKAFNQNPALAGYMVGQEDELETLGGAFKAFFTRMPGQRGSALDVVNEVATNMPGRVAETGTLGVASMATSSLALMSEMGILPAYAQPAVNIATQPARRLIESERSASRARYSSNNALAEGILAGGESVPLTLAALALRNPYAGASVLGFGVGAESVYEGRDKGLSRGASLLYGVAQGIPEAAFELVPMGELMKLGGRGFLSGFGRYMLAEVPGEILTTTAQSFTDWAMLPENKDRTFADWASGLSGEYAQTVLGVLGGGSVTVTTAQGFEAAGRFASRRAAQREMAAFGKFEGDWLDMMGNAVSGSTLRSGDPEAFANLMRDMATERGVSTVLVPGEAVRDYLQSSAFEGENDPLAPYQQAALEAAAAGNDIALPIETALTTLPGSKAWEALKDDMRLTAGGMSRRQAEALEASEEALIEEFRKQAEETDSKSKKQGNAREARIAKITTKLEEDGGFAPAEAARQAELLVARMTTRAARMGRDDEAVDQAVENLSIRQVMPPELQRAMAAQEQDMVVAALRGNTKGSTSRAVAAAAELRAVLARQGWTPEQLSDEQLGQVIERMRAAGEKDGREYRADGERGRGSGIGRGQALADAPRVQGEQFGPIEGIVAAAEAYAQSVGIDLKRQAEYAKIDEAFATRLADAYEALEHNPTDPAVAEAYSDLIAQTRAQYDALVAAGITFSFGDPDGPYFKSGWNALRDLRDNQHMQVFATKDGYGSDEEFNSSDNPLLVDTGLTWPDHTGVEQPVYANDLFRAVHDAFGHGIEGAGFRAEGEENAWQAHSRLFTGPALAALTSETRGQNSWVNYGPNGEFNRTASAEDTIYGDQKAGLLPSWAWTENVVPDMEPTDGRLDEALSDGESAALAAGGGIRIGWRPERIRDLLSTYGYNPAFTGNEEDAQRSKAVAGRLTPDQFLGLTASASGRRLISERVEGMEDYGGEIDFDRMRDNVQPIFLVVSVEGGFTAYSEGRSKDIPVSLRVVGHEGRHRMTMLKKAGVTSVPVVIIVQEARGKVIPEDAQLGPQRSRSDQVASGDTPVDLEGMVPISYANREKLAQEFGQGRELFQAARTNTIRNFAEQLDAEHIAKHGGPLSPLENPEHFEIVKQGMLDAYREMVGTDDDGSNWYGSDIADAIEATKAVIPELADPTKKDVMLTLAAVLSPQRKPTQNWEEAVQAMQLYLRTGRMPTAKENGKAFGLPSTTTSLQLLDYLIQTKGEQEAMAWLAEPHNGREVAELRRDSGLFGEKKGLLDYKASEFTYADVKQGYYVFGPKVGAFAMNVLGLDANAVTVDIWASRTYNRLAGRLISDAQQSNKSGVAEAPSSARGRGVIQRMMTEIAAEVGSTPSAVQAALWYYEQGLYRENGIPAESTAFAGAAQVALERRGLGSNGDARGLNQSAREFEQATIFYSALERAAQAVKTERAPAQQWVATLKNAPGVKAEELEWTGIIDWLEAQTGQVDKSQVVETIQRGGIVIREIGRGNWEADPEEIEEYEQQMEDYNAQVAAIEDTLDERVERLEREFEDKWHENYNYSSGYFVEEVTEDEDGNPLDPPKYRVNSEYYDPEGELHDTEDAAQEDMWENYSGPEEADAIRDAIRDQNFRSQAQDEIDDEINDLEEPDDPRDGKSTRWYNYSLAKSVAGGIDTYFEWLLTLPPGVGGNPEEVFREGHWGEEGEGVVVHARGHERKGADGKRILFLDEIQSQWHKEARDRFRKVLRQAIEELYGKIGYMPREQLGEPFSNFPPDLLEKIKDSINGGKVKPHDHWKAVAEWLTANPSDFGNSLLEKVTAANRGYRAPPDPEKVAEAESALAAARYERDAKMAELVDAIVALGGTYGIKIETGALSASFPDTNVRFLRGKMEDLAQTEWIALGLMKGEEGVSPDALKAQARRVYELYSNLTTVILATNDRVRLGDIERLNEAADLVSELEGRPFGEIVGEFAERSKQPGGGLALSDLYQQTDNALQNVRLRQAELNNVNDAGGIPDAPFRDTWYLVAMKRVIAKAAAEGYDQIAWIKQGENNGGMDDDYDWFYGRVLPNMVNKLLKPYKGKVTGLFVDGLERAETPESIAFDGAVGALRRFDMNVSLGLSEAGFDDLFDRTIVRLDQEIERWRGIYETTIDAAPTKEGYGNRLKELEEGRVELMSRRGELKANFFAAQEAYIPGLLALDEQLAEAKARRIALQEKAGFVDRVASDPRDAARSFMETADANARLNLEMAQTDLAFEREVLDKMLEAWARGETEINVPGTKYSTYEVSDEKIRGVRGMILRAEAAVRQYQDKIVEIGLEDFDAKYDAAQELLVAIRDERALERQRQRMFELPTNLGFDITPELREAAASGFPLFQPDHKNMPRGRILFSGNDDQGAVIELFQGRDLSTLIHESSHLWLEELKADAADPNAPEQVKRDWQIVLDWFKANGHEVKDGIIPVGAHEMWARGGERYMREGKAPSVGLKRAFETFRSWLTNLYKTVRGLNSPITPEIREVFDRLLATDDEIAEARQMQGMDALFNTAVEAGMSPDEFANYQEQVASARAEAQGRVLEKAMADIAKRETRLGRERRRQIKDQVTKAAEDVPLFKALAVLREERMDRAALVERFGEDVVGQLPSRVPPLYAEGGTDSEIIAEMAGFNSAEDMVNAMVAAEADQKQAKAGGDKRNLKARFIDQMTDQAFAAQYGDPMTPEQMLEEAQDAVANDRQGEVIASEIAALARKSGKTPTPYQMARQWARGRVRQGVYVAEASKQALERHRRAIAAAGREAEQALLAGDMEAAYRAKQKQMLSSALLMEAKAAHEEVETARARMERIAKARTMKSVDQDYLEQAHGLLEEVDLKQRSQTSINEKMGFDEWLATRGDGEEVFVPDRLNWKGQPWSRLTVEQITGLDDTIKSIIHLGRFKQTMLDNQERRDFEAWRDEARAGLEGTPGRKIDEAKLNEEKSKLASIFSNLAKMEVVAKEMDNDTVGPWTRLLTWRASDAANYRDEMRDRVLKPIAAAYNALDNKARKRLAETVDAPGLLWKSPDINDPRNGTPIKLTRWNVLAMALNMGNQSSLEKLARGYGISIEYAEAIAMDSLNEQEWAFVQSVWDSLELLWPDIAKVEREMSGVAPERVEVRPIRTPFGELRGGYYPVVYDPSSSQKAEDNLNDATADLFGKRSGVATASGHTKARTGYAAPILLSPEAVIFQHVEKVITRNAYAPWVRDVLRAIKEPSLRAMIDRKLGPELRQMIEPWLRQQVREGAANEAMTGVEAFLRSARVNVTVVSMGLRWSTGVAQTIGLANSVARVGLTGMQRGIRKMLQNPVAAQEFVFSRSPEMARRNEAMNRDVAEAFRVMRLQARGGGPIKRALKGWQSRAQTMAFWHIGMIDRWIVSMPTWLGAYENAIRAGATDEEASRAGDSAVRLSQGSGVEKDLSAWQSNQSSEALKFLTMFYTPFNVLLNAQWEATRSARRGDWRKASMIAFWMMIATPLFDALLAGDVPDDDDEEGWASWLARNIGTYQMAGIPILRDVASYGERKFIGEYATFGPGPLSRIFSSSEKAAQLAWDGTLGEDEISETWLRTAIETPGFFLGLPTGQVSQTSQFLYDVGQGTQRPETFGDWYQGMTKGKIKED